MPRPRKFLIALLAVVVIGAAVAALMLRSSPTAIRAAGTSGGAQFVGGQACAACHKPEHDAWTGSDHDWAMKAPTEQTVFGDFNDASFTHFGVTSRFFRRDGKFIVNTEGVGGKMQDFEVKYTFGYKPLQQYLIEFPGGRLQCLTIAWDTINKKWFHLYQNERITADDPLHWTKRLQNWNYMCADCHSTNLKKNYDVASDSYHTTWSEINVSCEACHGPGSEHVQWAEGSAWSRLFTPGNKGLTTALKGFDTAPQLNICFPCHARRQVLGTDFVHGENFFDHYLPEVLREGLYFPDGQILDEVYEEGSFTQSKMYHKNVRCSDCHDPHTTKVYTKQDNFLCIRCHQPDKFDVPAHHHHQPGTPGGLCINCHMPTKTYMVVDVRRDHSLRLPRPDISEKLGTPNACNQCHTDKDAKWAADAVVQWYGPNRPQPPHYADAIAAGRAHKPEAEPELIKLAGDPDRAAIVRATALLLLRDYGSAAVTDAIARGLADPHPLVRVYAVGGLERIAPAQRIAAVEPMLTDPIRAVRIEAARVLLPSRPAMAADTLRKFDAALAEYTAAQFAVADQPPAHVNLGVMYHTLGDPAKAIEEYQRAIKMDPTFVPAKINLAMLYNERRDNAAAEKLLREVIVAEPRFGDAYYSLGLLLAEQSENNPAKLAEAMGLLLKAAELMPDHPRVQYNAGLALQRAGRNTEAEQRLLRAVQLEPNNRDFLYAAAVFYAQRQQWDRAYAYVDRMISLNLGDGEARQFLMQIQAQMLRERTK